MPLLEGDNEKKVIFCIGTIKSLKNLQQFNKVIIIMEENMIVLILIHQNILMRIGSMELITKSNEPLAKSKIKN